MIQNIRLQNFRSYTDDSFEFGTGVNIIVGPNGSGKTNLLEALQVISAGTSYRAGDQELIRIGASWARLDAETEGHNRTLKIKSGDLRPEKSYDIDNNKYKILKQQHKLPLVLFEPNHLQLLHNQPENRRAYLDNLLEQLQPGFTTVRKHYRRVLYQRNALLKSAKHHNKEQFFVWNLRLSELGGSIARHRHDLIDDISGSLAGLYNNIAGTKETKLNINYKSKLPRRTYESALLKSLEQNYQLDQQRGFTGSGPHRDDFEITFDGRPADEVASRGEVRTVLLALKIHEVKMFENKFSKKPVLLLDDVFSELDGRRRHALTEFLKDYQTFITTTDADIVLHEKIPASSIIPLGSLKESV